MSASCAEIEPLPELPLHPPDDRYSHPCRPNTIQILRQALLHPKTREGIYYGRKIRSLGVWTAPKSPFSHKLAHDGRRSNTQRMHIISSAPLCRGICTRNNSLSLLQLLCQMLLLISEDMTMMTAF